MRSRLAEEKGFGLIELLFAMVLLNIGILALVAAFNSGAAALSRSAANSSATAVADKVMETYRDLQNKAIFLKAPSGGGGDVSGWPNGIPTSASTWYSLYQGDTAAYSPSAYYNYASSGTGTPLWITDVGASGPNYPTLYPPLPATASGFVPSGMTIPGNAVQGVVGPDGQTYPVFTYIIAVQPSASGGWMKLVTVVVRDPRDNTKVLARQSSLFDPNVAP